MNLVLHLASFLLYGVAAALLGFSFARGDRRLPSVAVVVVGLGLLIHAWSLGLFTARWGELPLVGLGPSLSTLSLLVGMGAMMAATLGHAGTMGLVLVPVMAALQGVAVAVGIRPAGEPLAFRGVWFVLHVFFAFVGYAGLTVAFAAGLMYLLQFRELKSKHFGAIFRFFPPLETLDRLGRQGLLVGFPFLTLAVVMSWAWAARFENAAPGGSKLLWVILSWLVFAGALLARTGGGRRSHRGALVSVVGFVVLVVVYVVLRVQTSHAGLFL